MAAAIQLDSEAFEPTDEELAARAAQGDQEAFAAIYRRWSNRVLRFAIARLRHREEAEDVAQEVFTALLKCLPSYRGESRFGTWLLGIAFHVICRHQRRRSRATLVPLTEIEETPEPNLPSPEGTLDAARTLARCADLLASRATPAQREIFWMHYGENRNTLEVAKRLRRSPETVRAQLCRARRALREATPGLGETLDA
jgi:RNA polymerase sigma-70 factor (ECF subfamily)